MKTVKPVISRLEWDSSYFGYPIAKVVLNQNDSVQLEQIYDNAKHEGYKLVYFFVSPLNCGMQGLMDADSSINLVDRKLTFQKRINNTDQFETEKKIKSYSGQLTDEMIELSIASGVYSRFNLDTSFQNREFERLYTEWILKSVNREIADEVFVYVDDEIKGFVTLQLSELDSQIGLIATKSGNRGQGIGHKLITRCLSQTQAWGRNVIRVATQRDNVLACKFYERNGFTLDEEIFIYHWWNRS